MTKTYVTWLFKDVKYLNAMKNVIIAINSIYFKTHRKSFTCKIILSSQYLFIEVLRNNTIYIQHINVEIALRKEYPIWKGQISDWNIKKIIMLFRYATGIAYLFPNMNLMKILEDNFQSS